MDIIGWLRNEAEYIKNSWNKATERPVEVPEYSSVEEMLTENYGMAPAEIQQGFRVFGENRKAEQGQENQIGDEPEAINNWARSAGVTPVTVINSELDAVHEQIRQDEEQTRLRNVIMNMALTDPKRIISEEEKRALFNAFRSNMQNDEDTMNFIDTNYVMREDYISWYKEQDYQDIEVVGISSICEGELHIHVEETFIPKWDISAQSIQQSKNTLEDTMQAYREWQSWLKDYEDQADLETAKRHLEIFGIPRTHPEYDKRLNEEIKSWKQAKEYAMAFSSGVKVIRDVGKAKTELHHIATDKSRKFDFKNHPAFKETGIDVTKDIDNLVELAGHRGRHTTAYHQEVQQRLDAVYERFCGSDKLESEVRNELNSMRRELLDGTLNSYRK